MRDSPRLAVLKTRRLRPSLRKLWPGLRLGDEQSSWQEPQWNAERRARPAGRAPHLASAAAKLRLSAFCFLFFRSWLSCRYSIVMVSALHCRVHLTKVGKAVRFFGTGVLIARVRIKKRSARMRILFPLPPMRAVRGGEGLGVGGTCVWLGVCVEVVPPPPTPPRHSLARMGWRGGINAPREREPLTCLGRTRSPALRDARPVPNG